MVNKFGYENINFELDDFGQNVNFKTDFTVNERILTLHLKFDFVKKISPKKMLLTFCLNKANCLYTWNPLQGMKRNLLPEWKGSKIESRSVIGTPILSFVGFNDENIATISLSDFEIPHSLSGGFSEEHGGLKMRIELFSGVVSLMDEYEIGINIDTRNISFYDAISYISDKFEESVELRKVPTEAKIPLLSTWYSDHQKLSRDKILTDCNAAKELGLDLIIIDDGWQTDDTSYGYGFCGDYHPSHKKVGDMKQLCKDIHEIGMKVMLWYSVSFIGEFSESFNKYKDMTLYYVPAGHYYVLDPRFKQVREFIVDFLCRSVKEWNIDGLKLDFIDSFRLPEDKIIRDGIDCNSLEESIRLLVAEIKDRLFSIKSNFLIEFRQRYIGPAMKSLGCMYRVGDCPGDFIANRMGIADLRFTSGDFAVHGDPIFFPSYSSKEYVACALANSIFGVIQFSVTPNTLNEEQFKVVKNYINFAKKYNDVLLDGNFTVVGGSNAYSECRSTLNGLTIVGYYEPKHIVDIDDNMIIINGSGVCGIYVKTPLNKKLKYKIKDCFGNFVKEDCAEDITFINLDAGSMLYL